MYQGLLFIKGLAMEGKEPEIFIIIWRQGWEIDRGEALISICIDNCLIEFRATFHTEITEYKRIREISNTYTCLLPGRKNNENRVKSLCLSCYLISWCLSRRTAPSGDLLKSHPCCYMGHPNYCNNHVTETASVRMAVKWQLNGICSLW